LLSILAAVFVDELRPYLEYLLPVWLLLLILHYVALGRRKTRQGKLRIRQTIGVLSMILMAVTGVVLGILSVFRRKKAAPAAPGPKREFNFASVRSEAGRWFGHTKTVVFATIPSGCLHWILGMGLAVVAVLVALFALPGQIRQMGWWSAGVAVYWLVILGVGGLLWGILTGLARGIRRVLYEGGEIERLYVAVRGYVMKQLGPDLQAGATFTQGQLNQILRRLAGEAERQEREDAAESGRLGRARAWLAGKLKAVILERLGCGLLEEAVEEVSAGNLRVNPQKLETAGLDTIKRHAARLATGVVDKPRLMVAVATLLLAALPFFLVAHFVTPA
jgi:hypothetical protein